MDPSRLETTRAVQELLELVGGLDASFLTGPRAVEDPLSVLEGYKWMFSVLGVAVDAYVHADSGRPRFVDVEGPYRKWGGDNPDAYYMFAPVDPERTYRVRVEPGDAVYMSLSVYGGPDDGRYSDRIVGWLHDREMVPEADGSYSIVLSPKDPDGTCPNWIRLESDAVCMLTRDYMADPGQGRRAVWSVTAQDPPDQYRLDDADLARRFRAAATWIRDQANIAPLPPAAPNRFDDPYPVPRRTIGWAAGDAAYAMGGFVLGEDEALIIEGRSPECAFWNLVLWNPFLHSYNSDYDRVSINGTQVDVGADGTWTVVVAARDPGHPNWVSTQGHTSGRIWVRWFLPSVTPEPLRTRVVPTDEVATA